MTIRITAIPRTSAPNSGYHPIFFAYRRGDRVWAIPGKGCYIGTYGNINYAWCDNERWDKLLSVRIRRILAMFLFFSRALFLPKQVILVHSFVYCIPLWMAGQEFALFIHGSDHKYLDSMLGRFLARRAVAVYGVGFNVDKPNLRVICIPNVFDMSALSSLPTNENILYDVIFVLRNAPVKNPTYPFRLFVESKEYTPLRIGVVGLDSNFLSKAELQLINSKTTAAIKIDYLGRRSFADVAQVMKSSKVMILPSHSEGVAKTMLEAFSSGLHVIISDKLRIPSEFEGYLIRADLENFPAVLSIIEDCNKKGVNQRSMIFAQEYLEKSISTLDDIYQTVSNYQC